MDVSPKARPFLGWRHGVTLLCFLGFLITYALRVNLSMAIVAMVNHTAIHAHDVKVNSTTGIDEVCKRPSETNVSLPVRKDGIYAWNEETQGAILSSFFYGYLITQIPGGILSTKFGGKWVFGVGTLLASLFTLLTPVAAGAGSEWLILVRVLVGAAE
ncbi:unnamed protein product, partial [Soboliphyme baturini]|uniref:MFS domain-containing protein n=1 Tax=Soboliphyme baturini TaxID=241478 RepID=A0A183IWU0_9BILA